MELSEKCIQTLEKEGFSYVYEGSCLPGATYSDLVSQEKVTLFVTEGSVETSINSQTKTLKVGDRFNIQPHNPLFIVVGQNGCQYVIGEMIEGDFKL